MRGLIFCCWSQCSSRQLVHPRRQIPNTLRGGSPWLAIPRCSLLNGLVPKSSAKQGIDKNKLLLMRHLMKEEPNEAPWAASPEGHTLAQLPGRQWTRATAGPVLCADSALGIAPKGSHLLCKVGNRIIMTFSPFFSLSNGPIHRLQWNNLKTSLLRSGRCPLCKITGFATCRQCRRSSLIGQPAPSDRECIIFAARIPAALRSVAGDDYFDSSVALFSHYGSSDMKKSNFKRWCFFFFYGDVL